MVNLFSLKEKITGQTSNNFTIIKSITINLMRALDLTWLVSPEVKPSIYLYEVGDEFPTMGRPPEANQAAQMKEFLT